ncbi:MAG: hypothetical protein PHR53_09300 [Bacteroidales bacterium]|nr:hypothetical protein [Bacteroidales bacterium]
MAHLLISLLFPLMMASMPFDSTGFNQDPVFDKENCTFRGIPLYGRVQVVEYGEDFKVRVVVYGEDIRIEKVSSHPNDCGEWEFVDTFPDFKIRFVEHDEDLKIIFVNTFPGIR